MKKTMTDNSDKTRRLLSTVGRLASLSYNSETFLAGSAFIFLVSDTLNGHPSDIDLYVTSQWDIDLIERHLHHHGYTKTITTKNAMTFSPRDIQKDYPIQIVTMFQNLSPKETVNTFYSPAKGYFMFNDDEIYISGAMQKSLKEKTFSLVDEHISSFNLIGKMITYQKRGFEIEQDTIDRYISKMFKDELSFTGYDDVAVEPEQDERLIGLMSSPAKAVEPIDPQLLDLSSKLKVIFHFINDAERIDNFILPFFEALHHNSDILDYEKMVPFDAKNSELKNNPIARRYGFFIYWLTRAGNEVNTLEKQLISEQVPDLML